MKIKQAEWKTFVGRIPFGLTRLTLRNNFIIGVEMGLVGNIRRLEITINDGDKYFDGNGKPKTNAGWHPHFHVLLFVSKDKFENVSDMEVQMKKV